MIWEKLIVVAPLYKCPTSGHGPKAIDSFPTSMSHDIRIHKDVALSSLGLSLSLTVPPVGVHGIEVDGCIKKYQNETMFAPIDAQTTQSQ